MDPELSQGKAFKEAALNGAQVTALVEVASRVGAGDLPKQGASAILQTAFNLSPEETAAILAGTARNPNVAS